MLINLCPLRFIQRDPTGGKGIIFNRVRTLVHILLSHEGCQVEPRSHLVIAEQPPVSHHKGDVVMASGNWIYQPVVDISLPMEFLPISLLSF